MASSHTKKGTSNAARKALAATLLAGAAVIGVGATAAPAHAYGAYQLAPINGHRAFGIGPMGSAGTCQAKANQLANMGAKRYGDGFARCIYDRRVGWLATSPWAQ